MDRSREVRRPNTAATNGLSRLRYGTTGLRDAPEVEEDVQMELQETVRSRDRANRRERDRDSSSRIKRRRVERSVQASNREGGEEVVSTEESMGDEEDNEPENRGSYQNQRKSFLSTGFVRPATAAAACKVVDEIIGVAIPRKARSSSVKRSHEFSVSGNVSNSPARRSFEKGSPSSSNISKSIGRTLKVSNSSCSSQEDIEMEIAEVLYGLKRQSQSSKKEDFALNSFEKLQSEKTNRVGTGTILNDVPSSDPFVGVVESEQPAKREISSPLITSEKCEGSMNGVALQVASVSVESQKEVTEQENPRPLTIQSDSRDGIGSTEKFVLAKEKSPSCPKLDVDLQDSTMTKGISTVLKVENQQEKIKINTKAPAIASSLERDGLIDLRLEPDLVARDGSMKIETSVEEVVVEVGVGETMMESSQEKRKLLTIDLEEKDQDQDQDGSSKLEQGQKQQRQAKPAICKDEKTAPSRLSPSTSPVPGWASSQYVPQGYTPPQPAAMPIDRNTGISKALQPPHSIHAQPRTKRCTTHHYIAHNIYLHQHFVATNKFWSAPTGSTSIYGASPGNLSLMPPTAPLKGNIMAANVNSTHGKRQATTTFPGHSGKDKSSETISSTDNARRKQVVFQQAPQPVPAGNLLHGPAFLFPLDQNQAAVATTATQSGLPKSAISINNASSSSNSSARSPTTSSALPAVAAAMSFSYPNVAGNEAPCLAILQSNGYPLPISTPFGTAPAFIGGAPAQAMPFFNGSFYSPQMFHPSQLQQQQPQSQPMILPTSSGSSSSHKKPQTQQPWGAQVTGNNFLTSPGMHSKQAQKQLTPQSQQSCKFETEMSQENTPSTADCRVTHTHKNVYTQNLTVPLQPLNFALMSSGKPEAGGSSGKHVDKQRQQLQQQSSKGGVELIPQAFTMSFASNGNSMASNINFSSMAQNPVIFQSLPEMTRQGYQVIAAAQMAHQKSYQISQGKSGNNSTNPEGGRKALSGKTPPSTGQTLLFDNSARTLNFMTPPAIGNWPSCAVTSTAITSIVPIAANSPNCQQQQQSAGAASNKAPTSNNLASSSTGAMIFSQTPSQSNAFGQSSQWKNSARNPASQAPSTSVMGSSSGSTSKFLPQQQGRTSQDQNQISFERAANQHPSTSAAESPARDGSMRSASMSGKAGSSTPTLQSQQSQQTENGSRSTQKSSPVCGRNVPSILSSCPGHLSELKY